MATQEYYKGHPILNFQDNSVDRYCTKLGTYKLATVVENLNAVLEFLDANGFELAVARFHSRYSSIKEKPVEQTKDSTPTPSACEPSVTG